MIFSLKILDFLVTRPWVGSVFLLLVSLPLTSCWPTHPSSQEVVGTWEADHSYGIETLVLSADGNYVQKLRKLSGDVIENRGYWRMEPSNANRILSGSRLVLESALVFDTGIGELEDHPQQMTRKLETVREWGIQRLVFNPDFPGFRRK
jgi:hypothetical protein